MSILKNQSNLSLRQQYPSNPKSIFFNIGKKSLDRENCFKLYHHDQNMKLSVSKLTEQQVKNSQIYNTILQKINDIEQARIRSQLQHQQTMKQLDLQIQQSKQNTHRHKFHIWQLRNQVMALQEQLSEQIQQHNQLDMWLNNQYQQDNQQQQQEYCQQNQDQPQPQYGQEQNQLLIQNNNDDFEYQDQNNLNNLEEIRDRKNIIQFEMEQNKNQLMLNFGQNNICQMGYQRQTQKYRQKLQYEQNQVSDNSDQFNQTDIQKNRQLLWKQLSVSCAQM